MDSRLVYPCACGDGNDKKIAEVTFGLVQLIATKIKGVTVVNPISWRLFELFSG